MTDKKSLEQEIENIETILSDDENKNCKILTGCTSDTEQIERILENLMAEFFK